MIGIIALLVLALAAAIVGTLFWARGTVSRTGPASAFAAVRK
jgi:hypothetical protein